REGERWEWVADSYPAGAVSLRSVADGNFVVVDRTNGKQSIIAEVDYSAAAVTLYEGAIHMIQAVPYQVERLDWEGRKAYVTRTHVDYYTDAIDYTKLKVLDCFASTAAGCGQAAHGEVHVVRRVAGYKKIRYYSHENIGYGPVNLPDQELHTTAVWWQLPQSALDAAFADRQQALDGFLGAACALHLVATVAVMAEQRDLQKSVGSGDGAWFASADQRGRGQLRSGGDGQATTLAMDAPFTPTVYLYDAFPGGVGLSAPLYARGAELLAHALSLVEHCDCRSGCPACVGPILAADEDAQRTPKALATRVLAMLIGP
ncbi:MAG: Zn-binding domain-containing protein, partial [Rhodanobacter sp.]